MPTSADAPRPIEAYIGDRLRQRRLELAMSEEELGSAAGLTADQLYKFENGSVRISASNLYDIAKILRVPLVYFFEGLPD